ncbi:MAG: anti-phage dCTP deaminase [Gemmataceae bacterium]
MDEIDHEIVIGLVSAVGTESQRVIDILLERLGRTGYNVEVVKISKDIIPQLIHVKDSGKDEYKRISNLMDAGNEARQKCNSDSILAIGAASYIYAKREKNDRGEPQASPRKAYIIDSVKRPEEVTALRSIYHSGFVLIGIHADYESRKRHLGPTRGILPEKAELLMQRDAAESQNKHGQQVNKTFYLADFFVYFSQNNEQLRSDIDRMVSLWFGNPYITPTFDEHAMFMAFAAALRSADMSRQVGAVVTKDSQILSTGANDCPKAGGGLYWPIRNEYTRSIDDDFRGRDYTRENGDSNLYEQRRIIDKIINDSKTLNFGFDNDKLRILLENSPLRDLTEYGRVVHAEMEALLSCARNGLSTVNTTLYCTTFPCHNCAKHIIAAGVKRVVYIEPYPKSKALDFHDEAIAKPSPESILKNSSLVHFDAFVGIGPRRFFDVYSMQLSSGYEIKRKDENGNKISWKLDDSQLRLLMKPTIPPHLHLFL